MPLRIKCRCGQETVLRYGEWVYVLLGGVVLALVFNTIALLVIFLRLEPPGRAGLGAPEPPVAGGSPGATPPREVPGLAVPLTEASAPPAPSRSAPSVLPPGPSGPLSTGSPAGSALEAGAPEPGNARPPAAGPSRGSGAGGAGPEARRGSQEDADGPQGSLPTSGSSGDRRPELPGEEPLMAALSGAAGWGASPPLGERVSASPPLAPWLAEPRLVRLWALDRLPTDRRVPWAFLCDPEPRVSLEALRLIPDGRAALAAWGSDRVLALSVLAEAAACWRDTAPLEKLAREAGAPEPLSALARLPASELAAGLRRALSPVLDGVLGDREAGLLRSWEKTAGGELDVAFLVDRTESMAATLPELQRAFLWLVPGLLWARPGARAGLVLYGDEVSAVAGFSEAPDALLDALLETRGEGGGDVPEGLHLALRAALSLGRLAWRPEARKVIVVLADAPPPYRELEPLYSLLRSAHREGGFEVHTLSLGDPGESGLVPSFHEIAGAGGGRAARPSSTAEAPAEMLRLLQPGTEAAAATLIARMLERGFRRSKA